MPDSFTQLLRDYDGASYPAPALWARLGAALALKMKQRGLWHAPPSYLGFPGYAAWPAPPGQDLLTSEPFSDLLHDACVFSLLDRWVGLSLRLRRGDNVDGLVRRNLDNFLTLRQQRADPVGYAAFKNAQTALEQALADGLLHGERLVRDRVLGPTRLHFASNPVGNLADASQIRSVWHAWSGWGELCSSLSRQSEAARRGLRQALEELRRCRIAGFVCRDLTGVLKDGARQTWRDRYQPPPGAASWEEDAGALRLIPLARPDCSEEDLEELLRLLACVARGIAGLKQARVRQRIEPVFRELKQALLENPAEPLPKTMELARRLEMPPQRISDTLKDLQRLFDDCRKKPEE